MISLLGSATWANGSIVDPVTRAFTVPSGSNRLLVVASPVVATGVSYNGTAMTRANSAQKLDLWYLVNPPVGTANIVWTFGSPWTTGPFGAVVVDGVDQAAPVSSTLVSENGFQGSPMSQTLAPPTGGSLLAFFHATTTTDPAVSGGDTDIFFLAADSQGLAAGLTGADDGTISFSGLAGQTHAALIGMALKPAAGGGGSAALAGAAADVAAATGSLTTGIPLAGPAAAQATATGTVQSAVTLVSAPLSRNNGTLAANAALTFVRLYNPATGALVYEFTGLSTDAAGVFRCQGNGLVAGTYLVVWLEATGQRGAALGVAA